MSTDAATVVHGTWTLVLEGVFCDCISRFITVYLHIIVFSILLPYISSSSSSFFNTLFYLCIWQAQYPMGICLVWIWWTHNKYNTIQCFSHRSWTCVTLRLRNAVSPKPSLSRMSRWRVLKMDVTSRIFFFASIFPPHLTKLRQEVRRRVS